MFTYKVHTYQFTPRLLQMHDKRKKLYRKVINLTLLCHLQYTHSIWHQPSNHIYFLNDQQLCSIIQRTQLHYQCSISTNITKAFLHITLPWKWLFLAEGCFQTKQWVWYLQIQNSIMRHSEYTIYVCDCV